MNGLSIFQERFGMQSLTKFTALSSFSLWQSRGLNFSDIGVSDVIGEGVSALLYSFFERINPITCVNSFQCWEREALNFSLVGLSNYGLGMIGQGINNIYEQTVGFYKECALPAVKNSLSSICSEKTLYLGAALLSIAALRLLSKNYFQKAPRQAPVPTFSIPFRKKKPTVPKEAKVSQPVRVTESWTCPATTTTYPQYERYKELYRSSQVKPEVVRV